MSFKIISSGIFSTIQDQGRNGYKHLGITESGAMDEYAYLWSQKLLNNKDSNALEVMVGLKIEVQESTIITICGADLGFEINGMSKPIWQTYSVQVGDVLSFPKRVSGQRSYLAVKDGFHTKKEYGSYATTLKENIGSKVHMSAILIGQISIINDELWREYVDGVSKSLKPFGASIMFRGQKLSVLAGENETSLVVILSFDTADLLREWFESVHYQSLIPIRDKAANVTITTYV